jgi:hypothetical protein
MEIVMKLERADLFSEPNAMTLREARTVQAAFAAGQTCCQCRQRATVRRSDGQYYCAMDARVASQRERRAAMKRA